MRSTQSVAVSLVCGFLIGALTASGQEAPRDCIKVEELQQAGKPVSVVEQYVCKLADDVKERKGKKADAGLILANDSVSIFILLVAEIFLPSYLVKAEDARVDKQVGGGDSSSGSTSLVSKGSVPAVLGFAVENGALSRTVSGTTMTFRGNPVGMIESFGKKGFIENYRDDLRETRFLRKLSFAVSFDADRGSMPGTFTGDLKQLSSYSIRYDILNKRDPRDKSYKRDWEVFVSRASQPFFLQWDAASRALQDRTDPGASKWKDAVLQKWFEETQQALAAATPNTVEKVLKDRIAQLPAGELWEETKAELKKFESALFTLLRHREDLLAKISKGLIVTFEYTNVREVDAPNLSNFKFIAEGALYDGRVDLTANGSFTIHNSIPATSNLNRVRDAQASFQLDAPVGNPQFVFSFSYKYERMMENAMMPGGMMMPDTKGDIHIGQLKFTVPGGKGTGVKIPLSITFANRTELIKENEVRGNIGITFDLDSIFARFKP